MGGFSSAVVSTGRTIAAYRWASITVLIIMFTLASSLMQSLEQDDFSIVVGSMGQLIFDTDSHQAETIDKILTEPPKETTKVLWLYLEFIFGIVFYYMLFKLIYLGLVGVANTVTKSHIMEPSPLFIIPISILLVIVMRCLYLLKIGKGIDLTAWGGGWADILPVIKWMLPVLSKPITFLEPFMDILGSAIDFIKGQWGSVLDALSDA